MSNQPPSTPPPRRTPAADLPVDIPWQSEIVRRRVGVLFVVLFLIVCMFAAFLLSVNLSVVLARGMAALPDIKMLENWRPNESTLIFDRDGNVIANIHGDEDRVVIPLNEISPNVLRAVMAIEDTRFYEHSGVDIRGTFRAFFQNIKGDDVQGGSTLTQQLVKNLFLTPERSIGRKIAEALLALRVERYYPKDKILEMYMNQVYWGNQAYGIEKAAQRYFRKPAAELTIAESALLAGLLKAPEGISPYAYPKAARKRQLEVLASMVKFGYITEEQRAAAEEEEVSLNQRRPKPSRHPFFVAHVIQVLNEIYGEDLVRRGGLKVYTTMDSAAQRAAEKSLKEMVDKLPEYSHVTQGAVVSIDVPTAQILALVGGTDFGKSQFNSATQARRAVGSTFKPFVYLTGFRLGMITPETVVVDQPISFPSGAGTWSPHNWDGRYMGAMTVRKALVLSRNTPTVQVGMKMGVEEVIKTARLAGITSEIDPNPSSLLGSSGVSPLELTTAFSTFARGGVRMQPTILLKVFDSRGKLLPLTEPTPERVFEENPVNNLVSILRDVVTNGTGKAAQLENRPVAGKTGTTDRVRDIWFMGFTRDMVGCVWLGNHNYVPLNGVFSSNSARVWHDFAAEYYKAHPDIKAKPFPEPKPLNGGAGRVTSKRSDDEDEDTATTPSPSSPSGSTASQRQEAPSSRREQTTGSPSSPPAQRQPVGPPAPPPPPALRKAPSTPEAPHLKPPTRNSSAPPGPPEAPALRGRESGAPGTGG